MNQVLSFLGLLGFLAICWLCSTDRSAVKWRTVFFGLSIQLVLGLVFFKWQAGKDFLYSLGEGVATFLGKSGDGAVFLFGPFGTAPYTKLVIEVPGVPPEVVQGGFVFAFQVLPTIIFFSGIMGLLYYTGIMNYVVQAIAWLMVRTMKTSGSESLSVASNIFVGQTEAPLLVRPFLERMTRSEIMAVMTGGFATIAGGVFALYVGFGIPAGHLIVASVMSAPAALVVAKLLVPETEQSDTFGSVAIDIAPPVEETEASKGFVGRILQFLEGSVESVATGATDGLKLALNVAAMLVAFLGLIAVINWALAGISSLVLAEGATPWSMQMILGYLFSPLAFLLGVDWSEVRPVGELLGYKVAVTELIAYQKLGTMKDLSPRTATIATYALCGFANFASIGIQIGGIAALAPSRRSDIARLGLRAMFAGAIASWTTACVAGILQGGE